MARTVVALVATAGLGLLASACGGSPSATGGSANAGGSTTGNSRSSRLLAFTHCMRSHGVPNFPDPEGTQLPKATMSRIAASNSHYRTATSECAHLLPAGNAPSQSEQEQVRVQGLKFAQCMRRHGVPLPDPASTGRIPTPTSVGINQGSPAFEAGNQACAKYRPPYMPSNAAYNAWARTHGT